MDGRTDGRRPRTFVPKLQCLRRSKTLMDGKQKFVFVYFIQKKARKNEHCNFPPTQVNHEHDPKNDVVELDV